MPDYIKNAKLIKKTYEKFIKYYNDFYQKKKDLESETGEKILPNKIGSFDTRDFYFYLALKYGFLNTDEMIEKAKEEVKIITSENKEDRFKAYDDFIERINSVDVNKMSTKNEKACLDMLLRVKLAQLPGNIYAADKEYKNYYFSNIDKQQIFDSQVPIIGDYFQRLTVLLKTVDIDIDRMKIEKNVDPSINLDIAYLNTAKSTSSYLDFTNKKTDHVTIELPDFAYYFEDIREQKDLPENILNILYDEDRNKIYSRIDLFAETIYSSINNYDSFSERLLKDPSLHLNISAYENIYIDGKPLKSMVDLSNVNHDEIEGKYSDFLVESIKSGRPIDIVSTYVENNKLQTKIIPIEFKYSKELEKKIEYQHNLSKYGWLRTNLFNWGPFKLKEYKPFKEAFERNRLSQKERNQSILEDRNTTILNKLNEKRDVKLEPGNIINENAIFKDSKIKDLTKNININTVEKVNIPTNQIESQNIKLEQLDNNVTDIQKEKEGIEVNSRK